MRNVLLIAKREYLEKIRGRAFRISTVLVPALVLLMIAGLSLTSRSVEESRHLVIAADSAQLADAVRSQLLADKSARLTVDVVAPADAESRATLLNELRNRSIDGILAIDNSSSAAPAASYTTQSAGDFMTVGRLEDALNRALLRQRLQAAGLKPDEAAALLQQIHLKTVEVNKQGKAAKGNELANFSKAMTIAFLLTMPILLYGMDMARSVIDEKASRIFEVMLATVRASDLLAGKLIGVGAVGLTQIAIWVLGAALLAGSALAASLFRGDLALHFSWVEGMLFPVYFVLGFFLYSAFFSGLAATCETAQELQMYMPLAAIPVWLSFGILPVLLNNPGSISATILSLFPLTSPFVMLPRLALEMPPLWQLAASVALLILSIWAVLWFSSRLYRVGILMYGKRATLPELLRWLRSS